MIITNTQNNSFTQPISTVGGTSTSWNSNYTTVNTQSAAIASVYTTVNAQSAANASVYTTVNAQSAANASVYTTVNANSATWGNTANNISSLSGNGTFNLYARNINLGNTTNWTSAISIPGNINDLTGGSPCIVTDIVCLIVSRSLGPTSTPTTGILFVTPPSFSLESNSGNSFCSSLGIGNRPFAGNYYRTANGVGSANSSGKYTYNGISGTSARAHSATLPTFLTTTLTSAIDAIVTNLPVNANNAFSGNDFHIKVDNEIMYVSAGGGSAGMTIIRGQLGTVAASHALGATVTTNIATSDILLADICFVIKRFNS